MSKKNDSNYKENFIAGKVRMPCVISNFFKKLKKSKGPDTPKNNTPEDITDNWTKVIYRNNETFGVTEQIIFDNLEENPELEQSISDKLNKEIQALRSLIDDAERHGIHNVIKKYSCSEGEKGKGCFQNVAKISQEIKKKIKNECKYDSNIVIVYTSAGECYIKITISI